MHAYVSNFNHTNNCIFIKLYFCATWIKIYIKQKWKGNGVKVIVQTKTNHNTFLQKCTLVQFLGTFLNLWVLLFYVVFLLSRQDTLNIWICIYIYILPIYTIYTILLQQSFFRHDFTKWFQYNTYKTYKTVKLNIENGY